MVRKKKRARNPRKNIALNAEKNAVFTAERYSVFAEEAIQFTVNGRNILMERKRKKMASLNICELMTQISQIDVFKIKENAMENAFWVSVRNNILKRWNTTENDVSKNQSSVDSEIRLPNTSILNSNAADITCGITVESENDFYSKLFASRFFPANRKRLKNV
ncbi:hypothetical protein TNCV_1685591 [Trichonephila clavipes]|nr:hypothetical protein TNCV_1685591 [Trichonephila clavipes]